MTIDSPRRRSHRIVTLPLCGLLFFFFFFFAAQATAAESEIDRARQLYNQGLFDQAIAAADALRGNPRLAASAALVAARARLERFRHAGDPQDLTAARGALVALQPAALSPQETVEWQIGIGEALVLEDELGPASEIFGSVLAVARPHLPPSDLEKLIDWWAGTASRYAETLTGAGRAAEFTELLASLKPMGAAVVPSRAAMYWSVVAERGAGDFDAAWNAAVAAWIRAGSVPAGDRLRSDLNRFVTETLIPERAQAHTGERFDRRATIAGIEAMTGEWRSLIARWQPPED